VSGAIFGRDVIATLADDNFGHFSVSLAGTTGLSKATGRGVVEAMGRFEGLC